MFVNCKIDGGDKAEEIASAIRQSGKINYTAVEGNTVEVSVGEVTVTEA